MSVKITVTLEGGLQVTTTVASDKTLVKLSEFSFNEPYFFAADSSGKEILINSKYIKTIIHEQQGRSNGRKTQDTSKNDG